MKVEAEAMGMNEGKRAVSTQSPAVDEPPPPRGRGRLTRALRTVFVGLVLLGLVAGFVGTLLFLYKRSQGKPPPVKTEHAATADIVKKAVATGSIVPRREILIKPRVSGIVKKLYVEAGQAIHEGDLIADVTIIPDVVALTRAEGQARSARIALTHADLELARAKRLREAGVLSEVELEDKKLDFSIKQAELTAANETLQVVKDGALAKSDQNSNTKIRSTVSGTVLDVPVLEGASVIESNNFNEGTTVAVVADMSDMIFLGKVDETDVGKIATGMDVKIQIGAIESKSFDGTLEFIASKGKLVDGAIQFEVKAALKPVDGVVIRAGYSANAGIVLERRDKVLALDEKLLQFDGERPFVEVKVAEGRFERRDVKVGVSDGIKIEVKEGVTAEDEIKVPSLAPPGQKN